jgi:hypothetical protein
MDFGKPKIQQIPRAAYPMLCEDWDLQSDELKVGEQRDVDSVHRPNITSNG